MSARTSGLAILLALLGLCAWWWLAPHSGSAPPVAATGGAPLSPVLPPAPATAAASPSTAAPPAASIELRSLLLPDRGISARPDSVRVGLAYLAEEDKQAHAEWLAAGGSGAGPAHLAELAQVQNWIEVPGRLLADGGVQIGPHALPVADRYDLQADATGPLHGYAASFTADTVPAAIAPVVAAGVRLLFTPAAGATVSVLLRRAPATSADPEVDGAAWRDLLQRAAPGLLAAYDETAVPVAAGQLLAPLPPGPLAVIVLVNDMEAGRYQADLAAGAVADLHLPTTDLQVAQALAVELQLEFVRATGRAPIAGLEVTWLADRGAQVQVSDRRGRVAFPAVDRQRMQRFELRFPAPAPDDLPTWPASQAIGFVPEDSTPPAQSDARTIRRSIELQPLQWLLLRTGRFALPGDRAVGNPYPIFVLQRLQEDRWIDTAADYFQPVPDGLAVSVETPAVYRVAALATPWSVHHSSSADTRQPSAAGRFPIALQQEMGRSVEVEVLRDGRPLAATPISLRSRLRGLPPLTRATDGRGRLLLEQVTVDQVVLELPGFQALEVDLGAARRTVELQADLDDRQP